MRWLNAALGGLVSAVLYPFRGLPPIVGLAFVALLTSVAILIVFRATSDHSSRDPGSTKLFFGAPNNPPPSVVFGSDGCSPSPVVRYDVVPLSLQGQAPDLFC